jgi:hypothetical protein
MMRAQLFFAIALAAAAIGCAEDELERAPGHVGDEVQVANRDPGPACRALAAVEVRSGRDDEPSENALRDYAAERGANYVVIDTFSVYDETEDSQVLTRARLFSCPRLAQLGN